MHHFAFTHSSECLLRAQDPREQKGAGAASAAGGTDAVVLKIKQAAEAADKPQDGKDAKDGKDSKDSKDAKDSKDSKDAKDSKDSKDSKDGKQSDGKQPTDGKQEAAALPGGQPVGDSGDIQSLPGAPADVPQQQGGRDPRDGGPPRDDGAYRLGSVHLGSILVALRHVALRLN